MSLGVDFSRVNILVFKVETFFCVFTSLKLFESEKVKFFLNRSFFSPVFFVFITRSEKYEWVNVIRSCPILGWVCKENRARGCTACLVTTVVELILGGVGVRFMTELPVLFSIWGPQDS